MLQKLQLHIFLPNLAKNVTFEKLISDRKERFIAFITGNPLESPVVHKDKFTRLQLVHPNLAKKFRRLLVCIVKPLKVTFTKL